MLPKKNRLKANDIKGLYSKGIKFRGEYGMLIVEKNSKVGEYEIAFVVSKKIGNAVQRHRMTRLLREISRKRIKENITGLRLVYIAFKYCDNYEKLEEEFKLQIEKAVSHT